VARGGAGTVYEAEDELLGRRLAYKVYHRAQRDREQIAREARAAIEAAGPGVLRIFDADPEGGWLATEWIERGSLRDILRTERLGELLPLSGWLPALLSAVERLHEQRLVHADLKPGNVLFRSPTDPILGDFGICRLHGEQNLAGTPGYLSPERLAGAPADLRDDVYALGRIIEDVLAAFEQAAGRGSLDLAQAAAELDHYEDLARACLADAASRPPDARATRALLAELEAGPQ
jgi:serine/threonine-protein kinase